MDNVASHYSAFNTIQICPLERNLVLSLACFQLVAHLVGACTSREKTSPRWKGALRVGLPASNLLRFLCRDVKMPLASSNRLPAATISCWTSCLKKSCNSSPSACSISCCDVSPRSDVAAPCAMPSRQDHVGSGQHPGISRSHQPVHHPPGQQAALVPLSPALSPTWSGFASIRVSPPAPKEDVVKPYDSSSAASAYLLRSWGVSPMSETVQLLQNLLTGKLLPHEEAEIERK